MLQRQHVLVSSQNYPSNMVKNNYIRLFLIYFKNFCKLIRVDR